MPVSTATVRRRFIISLVLFLGLSAAATATLHLDSYGRFHLMLASIFGLFGYFTVSKRTPPGRPHARALRHGAAAVGIVLLAYGIFFLLAFNSGLVRFTYAGQWLNPGFRAALPFYASLFYLGTVLGIELYFRYFGLVALPTRFPAAAVALQAMLFLVWWSLVLYPHLTSAEPDLIWRYLVAEFLIAAIAGQLYLLGGNVLVSGLWTTAHEFGALYLLNDIEFDLLPAVYLISPSYDFYHWKIAVLAGLVIMLAFWHRLAARPVRD